MMQCLRLERFNLIKPLRDIIGGKNEFQRRLHTSCHKIDRYSTARGAGIQNCLLLNTKTDVSACKPHIMGQIFSNKYFVSDSKLSQKLDPDLSKPTLEIDPFKKSMRIGRPLSPHFTIYQPQITWIGSIFHRITGSGIASAVYAISCLYVVYPFTPEGFLHFLSYIPHPIIFAIKAIAAASFFYHFFNGVRHLVWDTTMKLKDTEVKNTGWFVVGLTLLTTALVMIIR